MLSICATFKHLSPAVVAKCDISGGLFIFRCHVSHSVKCFVDFCVKGIKANHKKINQLLNESLMLVTALAPKIGYDNASKIAKTAHKNGTNLKEETLKTGLISEKEYAEIRNSK